MSRPLCACCCKPYGSRNTTETNESVPFGEPLPPLRNLPLVREEVRPPLPAPGKPDMPPVQSIEGFRGQNLVTHVTKRWVRRVYWDGESYLTPYKPFCTLRCALSFAECAHRNGFRVQGGAP